MAAALVRIGSVVIIGNGAFISRWLGGSFAVADESQTIAQRIASATTERLSQKPRQFNRTHWSAARRIATAGTCGSTVGSTGTSTATARRRGFAAVTADQLRKPIAQYVRHAEIVRSVTAHFQNNRSVGRWQMPRCRSDGRLMMIFSIAST